MNTPVSGNSPIDDFAKECATNPQLGPGADSVQRLALQPWEPGPEVKKLDDRFGDAEAGMQPHEQYREMRALAIRLEHRLRQLENA